MGRPKTNIHPYDEEKYRKLIREYDSSWILLILRNYTDRENPKSVSEIAGMIVRATGIGSDGRDFSKTVGRRLDDLIELGHYLDSKDNERQRISCFAYQALGGVVRATGGNPVRYYFEPTLDKSDVSMICASLNSTRYLSSDEKRYLSKRTSVALSYNEKDKTDNPGMEVTFDDLPKKPLKTGDINLPSQCSVTLKKINTIYHAINHGYKLSIFYGTYFPMGKKIRFVQKNAEQELITNPYAMLSQNGQLYLVCTCFGYDRISHYRVDRIFSVEIKKDDKGEPVKRDKIPQGLEKYFDRSKHFDSAKYTSKYPYMAYSNNALGIHACEFSCHIDSLPTVVDYFGTEIGITTESDEDTVIVRVLADYTNVLFFCEQHSYIGVTPISPPELVKDVRKTLEEAIKRMGKKS